MRSFLALLAAVSIASGASAQSNLEKSVIRDLQKAGVPEDCLAKVTSNDAAKISSWFHDPDMRVPQAKALTKKLVSQICARE